MDLVSKLLGVRVLDGSPSELIARFDDTLIRIELHCIVNKLSAEKTRLVTRLIENCDHIRLFLATRLESPVEFPSLLL